METAQELYNALLSYSANGETSICQLHKPCSQQPLCATTSKTPVQDFDYIEKKIATGVRSSLPSCDGVALSVNHVVFCFVEIKGWDKFVQYNITDSDNLSSADKTKIDSQVATYNLKGKLEQSIRDCEQITNQNDLFMSIPYAYVIVTDINSENDAISDIAANLSSLAETASVWTYCDDKMVEALDNVDIVVKKVYSHCRDFDQVLSRV